MTNPVKKRLLDALEACEAIQEFTQERSFQEYERNLMLQSAVERQLEIVGEALGQAADKEETLEEDVPAIPRIVSLRNRVIHGYDTVDDEIIWDIVQNNVPTLSSQIRELIDAENGDRQS